MTENRVKLKLCEEKLIQHQLRTKMMKTGGILKTRHNAVNETVELLVFGYQSKLYRDDVKALEFDRESHLIPAPYDNNVLLSRFVSDFSPNYSICICIQVVCWNVQRVMFGRTCEL